ncbi:putative cytochrome P450 [Setomelanomma holmii]|uniref:Cytochrome P450 n=1 Tax=Setomelanomma holmii TaxID=210430 RepID=A0A9P4HL98_9PLEO|nr:putative cytochrome P450 [Setomelanomma holmii]
MASSSIFWLVALLVPVLYRLLRVGRRPYGYPPGPPTVPVLGNLHQMAVAMTDPHLQFEKWAQEYGPIYSLMLGTKTMIILSNDVVIKDLIDKKSAIYSSRPDLYIGKMLSGGLRMVMEAYGPTWRTQRKLIHNALSLKKVAAYQPYQEMETRQLLYDILHDSTGLLEHFRRWASSLITSVVFGFRWKTLDDSRLQEFFGIIDSLQEISAAGATTLPDIYPALRKIPPVLYPMSGRALSHHKHEKSIYTSYFLRAKDEIVNKLPTVRTCTCEDIVEAQKHEAFDDDFAAYIACTLFEAGSETTSSELYGFAQAMLLYPDAQRKGQVEVDTLCGDDRWPTFNDMSELSYVRACVKETLRWMPATLIGAVPHALTEDDHYNGYKLPAGAIILLNVWTIHRDPKRYTNPDKFLPERFLGDDTTAAESFALADATKRDHFSFGSGRRVCPGIHLADRSIFLVIARMLWAFDIKPKLDSNGEAMLPKQDQFVEGMAVHPKKFDVEIVPKSEKRRAFVEKMWAEASNELDGEGQFLQNPI